MAAAPGFLSGLFFSFSLIVAIGAQNAYVLRQGALGAHVRAVVAICAASDALLIAAGVGGMGAVVSHHPDLLRVVRATGALLLSAYALLAARRVLAGTSGSLQSDAEARSRRAVIAASLAFTWLNPAVYLDTLVLLGSVATAHPASRWWFGAGASTASVSWFIALGFGARRLSPLLSHAHAARILDILIAVVMVMTAVRTLAA